MGIFSGAGDFDENSEFNKISSSGHLTQYIYNLRMWIACTILHRLNDAIEKTNLAFSQSSQNAECRGFSDIQIGKVGLDRLKKTAEIQQLVSFYVPMLPMIIPFLEISSNQEYLVQRIKDLAKGCVLSEYKWNGGGSYNGINWDEHLPVDSAVCTNKKNFIKKNILIKFFFFRLFFICFVHIWIVNYLHYHNLVVVHFLIDML